MPDPQKSTYGNDSEMKFVVHRWPPGSSREGEVTLALDRDYTPEEVERFAEPRNDAPSN